MTSYVSQGIMYIDRNEVPTMTLGEHHGRWFRVSGISSIIQYTRILWFTIAIDSDRNLWFMQDVSYPTMVCEGIIYAELEPMDIIRAVTTSGDRIIIHNFSIPEPVKYPNKLWKLFQNHALDIFGNLYDGDQCLVETDVIDISPIHGCGTKNGMLVLKGDGSISGRDDVSNVAFLGHGCALDIHGIIWFIGLIVINLSEEYNIQPISDVSYVSYDNIDLSILYNTGILEIHHKDSIETIPEVGCLSHQAKKIIPNRKSANKV